MSGPGEAPLIVVAAGGTAGHLFPAEALAAALIARGAVVDLATDERATRYGTAFPARATHVVPSATISKSNPATWVSGPARILGGIVRAYAMLARLRPAAVIGFGGYPTLPPVLAARLRGLPTLIHEQNGVLGRANRLLAPWVDAIATSFPRVLDARPDLAGKATHTGNPVRPNVIAAATTPYPDPQAAPFRLLVFGGSQGARVMADVVPAAIELLTEAARARLAVTQQARGEDVGRVRDAYARAGVAAEVSDFFSDLPARMAASHLVVSRSGASTVAELAVIGRPGVLVPLPHALDQDQLANASALEAAGGAVRIDQPAFTPKRLASELGALMGDPARLRAMAEAARRCGTADAGDRLAELVLRIARQAR
ncbi:MAG TPA: undecaprenyldiphospho-muramoylpentapeptide beta-N-acetylglucosaminyltransferase [Xanthobacteraceae bacterium]|nr:undecaprenyldiphospho-muramoylpentapeptide beta-N-acetylglucosaminyltransferase [Xanthobacteraceae bacterium]